MVAMAKGTCEQGGQVVEDDDVMAVTYKYTALFSASHCWEQLCDEELNLQLIGDYFKECADIDLPFASTSTYTPDDAMISCMLDFAMSTPHEEFGLSPAAAAHIVGGRTLEAWTKLEVMMVAASVIITVNTITCAGADD